MIKLVLVVSPEESDIAPLMSLLSSTMKFYLINFKDVIKFHAEAGLDSSVHAKKYLMHYHLMSSEWALIVLKSYIEGLIKTFRLDPQSQTLLITGYAHQGADLEMLSKAFDVQGVIYIKVSNMDSLLGETRKRLALGWKEIPENLERRLRSYPEEFSRLTYDQRFKAVCISFESPLKDQMIHILESL